MRKTVPIKTIFRIENSTFSGLLRYLFEFKFVMLERCGFENIAVIKKTEVGSSGSDKEILDGIAHLVSWWERQDY